MAWTTPQDVRDRWLHSEPIPVADATLQVLIDDIEDSVLERASDIQARLDDESVPLQRVVKIVARAAIRALRNPDGVRQVNETTGPFTGSMTFGGKEPRDYLTDKDVAELRGKSQRRAFTIDRTGPVAAVHADVCSLNFGAAFCSCAADLAGYPLYEV